MKLKYMGWALVALGASSAVQAQQASSVTVYGVVDVGVYHQSGFGNGGVGEDHYHTSRLGFKGVEDLGGGLSAIFKLENRFLARSGAQQDSAAFFNDEAYVGLRSNSYGTLLVGRVYSPFYLAVAGRIDPFNGDGIGSMTGLTSLGHNLSPGNPYYAAKNLPNEDVRTNNSVTYLSPAFSGFTAQVQKGFANIAGKPSGIALALRYDSPTLFAETGYERKPYSLKAYSEHIGGGYVLGPAKFSVGYTTGYYSDDEYFRGNKASSEIAGITYAMGSWSFLGAIARMRMDEPTLLDAAKGTGSNLTKWALGAEYHFSKRTTVYMHYAHFSAPVSIIFVGNSAKEMVGIDHAF
jgi:predicted porin